MARSIAQRSHDAAALSIHARRVVYSWRFDADIPALP
jgi:hypothetical protein